MGSNRSDLAGYLNTQAGPGRDGVVTICWDNSLREDIVQASEVILLTIDTDPPDDIPPAGDDNAVPGFEDEELFEDSEEVEDNADNVSDNP